MKQPISILKLLVTALRETNKRKDQEGFDLILEKLEATSNGIHKLLDEYTLEGDENIPHRDNLRGIESICQDVLDALELHKISIVQEFQISKVIFLKNNLRSIIYNLMHNAVKYRHRNRATVIRISAFKIKGFVVFSVEDIGIGIAYEHQETIFKKSSTVSEK